MTYQKTSREAWRSFLPHSPKLDDMIIAVLDASGADGATCEEIEKTIERSHQAVSGNLRHLVERGLVQPTEKTRPTSSGRKAIVWGAAAL